MTPTSRKTLIASVITVATISALICVLQVVAGVTSVGESQAAVPIPRAFVSPAPGSTWLQYPGSFTAKIQKTGDKTARLEYSFGGSHGDVINIAMDAITPGLDAYLRLYDSSGKLLNDPVADDDRGGGRNSLIANVRLTNQTYKIEAGTYNDKDAGWFRMTISQSIACGGAISFGETKSGSISSSGQQCRFTFDTVYSASVSILMERESSGLDPFLKLYDPSGKLVNDPVADDDRGGGATA